MSSKSKLFQMCFIQNRFKRRFRLSKEAFSYVLSAINVPGHMSTSVTPILQLAATLNLLASGSFQHNVGNDFLLGLAQSTVCKIVRNISSEIENVLCSREIQFLPDESLKCMESFMEKFKCPGGWY